MDIRKNTGRNVNTDLSSVQRRPISNDHALDKHFSTVPISILISDTGLQALDPHEWIQIDPHYRQQIQLKEKIFHGNRREDFFLCKDEAYEGAMEILKMLIDYLPDQYPNMFEKNHSKSKIINLITNEIFDLTQSDHFHPLEIAALLVQEDLVIMQRHPTEDTYHANVIRSFSSSVYKMIIVFC